MHRGYGYIKLWRKIIDHPLHPLNRRGRDFTKYEAMIDLIMMAHGGDEPKKIIKGNQTIKIKRGQLDKTNRQLAERWAWASGKVNNFLRHLKDERFLSLNVNRWFTVITIQEYEKFNPRNERNVNGTRTERERNVNTIEREIMINNENNSEDVRQKLLKWFTSMEDVKNPGGLVKFFFDRYTAEIIKKALANSTCTSRGAFSELCVHYSKKKS